MPNLILRAQRALKALYCKGTWDADANTPTLSDDGGGGKQGDYYVISVAGTTSIDDVNDWEVGDWIVNNGIVWQKVDNTDLVASVNTKKGVVVLNPDDLDDAATTHKFISQAEKDKIHDKDKDTKLDEGQANEVTAAELKDVVDNLTVNVGIRFVTMESENGTKYKLTVGNNGILITEEIV